LAIDSWDANDYFYVLVDGLPVYKTMKLTGAYGSHKDWPDLKPVCGKWSTGNSLEEVRSVYIDIPHSGNSVTIAF